MRSSHNLPLLAAALALALATPASAQRQQAARAGDAIDIPFEKYQLRNGLTVILAPDRTTPRVMVNLWYHVGSKNEVPGRTGFAHLFEHVMFTGSGHVPYGLHDRLTQGVGGYNNGSTSNDRTNYFQEVPSNYLETVIWMEADRMGFLLEKLDSAKFVAQRDVVQNERRQGVDNQPYGRASEIIYTAMYPSSHPYSWPVIGYLTDLQAASLADVKNFFRVYYAPSNATISIVGDFEPAQAKAYVAKYFADLPRGRPITRPSPAPPALTDEKRLVFEDRVQLPRLYLRWPTVGMKHDDAFALQVLGSVLTGSRTARLTRTLVYDRQQAANVSAFAALSEAVGDFRIEVQPRPGNTLTDIETTVDSVLTRLRTEGPGADEIQRALAGIEFQFVAGLESLLGKAEMLNSGQVYFNDPARFKTQYARLRAVTAADVKRVANTYLGQGRVVLSIVPQGKVDDAARAAASTRVTVAPDGARYIMETR